MEALEARSLTIRQSGPPEWCALLLKHPNMLLEGTGFCTEEFLSTLTPYLRQPILWRRPGEPLELEATRSASLVLEDVAELDREQQNTLSRWLQDAGSGRQIVSITSTPLFPLVERGLFDPALYYRLNVILLQV